MKNMKLLFSLVLVVIMCVVLAGCADRPSSGNEGWNDPSNPGNQEWTDPENPGNQEWTDPENPGNQEWPDPNNPGNQEWPDPNNPGETTEPSEPSQTGNYRHEIDGWVFYTEHNIDDYIRNGRFYPTEMLTDVFGIEAIPREGQGITTVKLSSDGVVQLVFGFYKDDNTRDSGGDWIGFQMNSVNGDIFIKYPKNLVSDVYGVDDSTKKTSYDLAVLSLFICEHIIEDGGYETFNMIHLGETFYVWHD